MATWRRGKTYLVNKKYPDKPWWKKMWGFLRDEDNITEYYEFKIYKYCEKCEDCDIPKNVEGGVCKGCGSLDLKNVVGRVVETKDRYCIGDCPFMFEKNVVRSFEIRGEK
jgi:hypothetical protein